MDVTFCFRSESRRTTLPHQSNVADIQRAFIRIFSDYAEVTSSSQFEFRVATEVAFYPLTADRISHLGMIIDVSVSPPRSTQWVSNIQTSALPPLLLSRSPLYQPIAVDNCQSTPSLSPTQYPICHQAAAPFNLNLNAEGASSQFLAPAQHLPSPSFLPASCPTYNHLNGHVGVPAQFSRTSPSLPFASTLFSPTFAPAPAAPYAFRTPSGPPQRNKPDTHNRRLHAFQAACHSESRFVVRLRGLPWTARRNEIEQFFCDERIEDIQIIFLADGRSSGEGLVEFATHEDLCLAKTKHRQNMGCRYIEIFPANAFDIDAVRNQNVRKGNSSDHIISRSERTRPERERPWLRRSWENSRSRFDASENSHNLHLGMEKLHISSEIDDSSQDQKVSESESESASPTLTEDEHEEKNVKTGEDSKPTRYVLRLRGLPYSSTRADILQFFSPIVPCSVHLIHDQSGRASGEGYVELASQQDAIQALQKDRQHMGHRYIEIFQSCSTELARALGLPHEGALNLLRQSYESPSTSRCILMRGLPYACTETDIAKFFAEVSVTPSKIHRKADGGEAYVEFCSASDAVKGMQRHKHYIGHRYVELFPVSFSDMAATVGIPMLTDGPQPVQRQMTSHSFVRPLGGLNLETYLRWWSNMRNFSKLGAVPGRAHTQEPQDLLGFFRG